MHTTTLPLGKYAKDPRFEIVQVEKKDAIRTDEYTIIPRGAAGDVPSGFELWHRDEPSAFYPHHYEGTLTRALRYALGAPAKVGPVGFGSWLHTDGREYAHDPATTAMRRAGSLRVGDVVDFPHIAAFEIAGPSEITYDGLGRPFTGYPVRLLNGGFNEFFRYQADDLVPVRFAR